MTVRRRLLSCSALTLFGAAQGACRADPGAPQLVEATAARHGLPPLILTALIMRESAFCPTARSSAGAIGYGQLMPGTARGLGVNPYDPVQNIWGAAKYLRQQWDTFKDWRLALAAYNAGPGAVIKYGGVPPYPETQEYVQKVLGTYAQLTNVRRASTPVTAQAPAGASRPATPALPAAPAQRTAAVAQVASPAVRQAQVVASVSVPSPADPAPTTMAVIRPGATSSPTVGAARGWAAQAPAQTTGMLVYRASSSNQDETEIQGNPGVVVADAQR